MDDTNRIALLNEMTGLETAKHVIDRRIKEITEELRLPGNFSAPRNLRPLPEGDPTVLGRDSLGRIKRTRNISPELREKKRQLITAAREEKLRRMREIRGEEERPKNTTSQLKTEPLASVSGDAKRNRR